jgi:hypothetical protein
LLLIPTPLDKNLHNSSIETLTSPELTRRPNRLRKSSRMPEATQNIRDVVVDGSVGVDDGKNEDFEN